MKDMDMKCRKDIEQNKAVLDKVIQRIDRLIAESEEAMKTCCNNGDFDNRARFTRMVGHLSRARGEMFLARCEGGEVQGGDFSVQSGGT